MNTQKEIGLWRSRSSSNLQVIVLLLNFLRWIDSLFYLHIIHRFIHTNERAHFQFTYLLLFFVCVALGKTLSWKNYRALGLEKKCIINVKSEIAGNENVLRKSNPIQSNRLCQSNKEDSLNHSQVYFEYEL